MPCATVFELPGQSLGTGPNDRESAPAMPWPKIPPVALMCSSWVSDFMFSDGHAALLRRLPDVGGALSPSGRGARKRVPLWAATSGYGCCGTVLVAIEKAVASPRSDM